MWLSAEQPYTLTIHSLRFIVNYMPSTERTGLEWLFVTLFTKYLLQRYGYLRSNTIF